MMDFSTPPTWLFDSRVALLEATHTRPDLQPVVIRAWATLNAIESDTFPAATARITPHGDICLHFAAQGGRHLLLTVRPDRVTVTRWSSTVPRSQQAHLRHDGVERLRVMADWLTYPSLTQRPPTLKEDLAELYPS